MSVFKDTGIVAKAYPSGEYDKHLTLILRGRGKTSVFAKGAGRPKSKFLPSSQPFALSEFVIFEGAGFLSLTQCQVINNFYETLREFECFCSAGHIMELMDKLLLPGMPCSYALDLALAAFSVMSGGAVSPVLAALIFEFRFLQSEGFSPGTDFCASCRKPVGGTAFFSGRGVVCADCRKRLDGRTKADFVPVSEAAVYAVKYILNTKTEDIFKFNVSEPVLLELAGAARLFRTEHLDAVFKSLDLLGSNNVQH